MKAINQQLDALNQIKVTDQNITDIELARVALAQKAAAAQVQQLLALGSLKDGWDAFWIEQQEQAEKPGKILYDGMNDAMNKLSGDLTKIVTGQHKKTTFGKDIESVGTSMVQASIKSMMQRSLGAVGKHVASAKPTGTAADPIYVVPMGPNPRVSLPGSGQLPPALSGAATGAAKSAGSGLLGWLGGLFGKGGGGGTAVDSSIEFMANGTDNADPGHVYGVAEAGEAELIQPEEFQPHHAVK